MLGKTIGLISVYLLLDWPGYDSNNQCVGASCCAVCQQWYLAAACLGLTNDFLGVSRVSADEVKITYGNGDRVYDGTPRQVDIFITCDENAETLTFKDFTQSHATVPPPAFYSYSVNLSSNVLCDDDIRCYLEGYHFNYISAFKNWSHTWTPSGETPQTIYYAPCSSGVPNGCGTLPPSNQCADKKDCCAVCETWGNGKEGACLGLSSQLLDVSAISNIGVKITYGGGDPVDGTERRVDVMIYCDPNNAELLTFVDFITPVPQNPPPPFYHYVLILSSNDLCGGGPPDDLDHIINKLKKFLPL